MTTVFTLLRYEIKSQIAIKPESDDTSSRDSGRRREFFFLHIKNSNPRQTLLWSQFNMNISLNSINYYFIPLLRHIFSFLLAAFCCCCHTAIDFHKRRNDEVYSHLPAQRNWETWNIIPLAQFSVFFFHHFSYDSWPCLLRWLMTRRKKSFQVVNESSWRLFRFPSSSPFRSLLWLLQHEITNEKTNDDINMKQLNFHPLGVFFLFKIAM